MTFAPALHLRPIASESSIRSRREAAVRPKLSLRLVTLLDDLFPGSEHVRNLELASADDAVIWDYARQEGYTIVSRDSDFYQRCLAYGHPPKVVWIRRGNCSTATLAAILRGHHDDLVDFESDAASAFLVLV